LYRRKESYNISKRRGDSVIETAIAARKISSQQTSGREGETTKSANETIAERK
jgi:hypothetical protein